MPGISWSRCFARPSDSSSLGTHGSHVTTYQHCKLL
uniref:Uncharacterized protein n=1 Tax=Anguilla anguilla TaxID=7936 RepID=A0A0E9SR75_ANGAN